MVDITVPGVMANELQAHLFSSLLNGHTADVCLVVRGAAWEGVYRLHRVVLIQAGFFLSLFQSSGFSESRKRFRERDEIDVVFEDPNITRAAFEICISRLYGGGPALHVGPGIIPTLHHPLTPSYHNSATKSRVPEGYHPTSPRLLLSLIVTAIYLSLPTVASKALSAVLGSVGPSTIVRYLDFARGKGIGPAEDDEPEAACGLESLAQPISVASSSSCATIETAAAATLSDPEDYVSVLPDASISKEDPDELQKSPEPAFEYGTVSRKVGEAAACWLVRWGGDILPLEQQAHAGAQGRHHTSSISRPVRPRRHTEASFTPASSPPLSLVPRIWSRGGISTSWACSVIGSDLLFVTNEKERYELAKAVFELRRGQGPPEPDEDSTWCTLFNEGIYYNNMIMDELMPIATDISPSTGKPYVLLSSLQGAHWDQSILRHMIISRPPSSSVAASTSPAPRDKEIGVAVSATEVAELASSNDPRASRMFYRVPGDSSFRLGNCAECETSSMDDLFDMDRGKGNSSRSSEVDTSEDSFFGLAPDRSPSSNVSAGSADVRWSPYQPLRFSVEFWDVAALGERSRLYSKAIWYAGSLFQVYVQVVRKKGVQLGVYMQRQSTVEALPAASIPCTTLTVGPPADTRGDRTHSRGPSLPIALHASASTPSIHRPTTPARAMSPSSLPRSTDSMSPPNVLEHPQFLSVPATVLTSVPVQPYRDSRAAMSAHFAIACHSATGAALIRFTSAPDVFTIGQSWGWKSSSRTEDYIDVADNCAKTADTAGRREVSLRATVVLGIV